METIYFKGTPCHTYGNLPAVGEKAPCFTLVTPELKEIHCNDFPGKYIVLNIFPSLDTAVCAMSVRKFNEKAAKHPDTVVLCVSMDLPFAAQRFCSAEGIKDVIPASAFRSPVFVQKYGVQLVDGPLSGLLARAVLIIDKDMNIIYRELVDEITHEPDYDAALKMLK
ncbi:MULTISPECIES: thiol peroxidase [Muribaculum]|jgi:thiol peroxidase|uniref:Thiol peroxidase n=1 Tax=Muribaculum caecicola TaxID=3038144 RepID=A0AC61S478_9BACT|nr:MULTISPECIES: thiol peroxidase [Muribaculum]THG46613.1 thiol peroxidase [Muribaculum caecicola]